MRISDWSSDVCSSDLAVVGLTEALALEGKPHGIRVNAVAPGTMKTAMIESLVVEASTMPDDLAPPVAFLLDRRRSAPLTGPLDVVPPHAARKHHLVYMTHRESSAPAPRL